ncbi:MAG: hypothetical protein AAB590_03835 [Patescibacteria group bacterium]
MNTNQAQNPGKDSRTQTFNSNVKEINSANKTGMRKEHWLYLVITILAIWIIASYVTAPKTEAPNTDDVNTSDTNQTGTDETSPEATGVTGGLNLGGQVQGTVTNASSQTVTANVTGANSVSVSNQPAGNIVNLDAITISTSGWAVVHDADESGNPGWMLGAQRFDPGSYSSGQIEVLRNTISGKTYFVVIHNDDGDKQFDYHLDVPITQGGKMVASSFVAL